MLTDKVNQRHAENKPISAIPVLALRCNYGETVLHVLSLLQACKRQWCTHLPDRHCAENVEEDEGAVSVILTQKVAVGQALDVWEGDKRKLCHHSAIKSEKKIKGEHGIMSGEHKRAPGYRKNEQALLAGHQSRQEHGRLKSHAAFSSPSFYILSSPLKSPLTLSHPKSKRVSLMFCHGQSVSQWHMSDQLD